jgi:hypothetical protein
MNNDASKSGAYEASPLLPCPFCGETVEYGAAVVGIGPWMASCSCGVEMWAHDEPQLIAAWNRRGHAYAAAGGAVTREDLLRRLGALPDATIERIRCAAIENVSDSKVGRRKFAEGIVIELTRAYHASSKAAPPRRATEVFEEFRQDPAFEYERLKLAYTEAMLERQQAFSEVGDDSPIYDELVEKEEVAEKALDAHVRKWAANATGGQQ